MPAWPRPERLVPPRLLAALDALQAGETPRALGLCTDADAADPLTADIVRLVRARAALITSVNGPLRERNQARRELRALCVGPEPALALLAAESLVDDRLRAANFAAATQLLRVMTARLGRNRAMRLWLDARASAVLLERRGKLGAAALAALVTRLERQHPAAVHASVHLLRAETALLADDPATAVAAAREARPHVRASGDASLAQRLENGARLLRVPFVEAEDWEEPLRTLSREELVELETRRPWALWVDILHRRARRRTARRAVTTLPLDGDSQAWVALEALLRTPRRRLSWVQAAAALDFGVTAAAQSRAERVVRELRAAHVPIRVQAEGFELTAEKLVVVFPTLALPALDRRILAQLATAPGTTAAALVHEDAARRTVLRHLSQLQHAGYVRRVGGGREARYYIV